MEGDSLSKLINYEQGKIACQIGILEYHYKIKNHTTALKLISEIESQVDSLLQTDISISFYKLCAFIHSNLGN